MSTWQPTACILCECNCGIVVQTENGVLAKIRGDKDHPASQGYTCNKALRLDYYQNNPNRLTSPMRRRPDGSYEEIDWETAISEVAAGFRKIADEYGGDKIFYYGGGGQGNHLGGAYSGAFLKALGARYRSNALAQEKTGEFWVDAHLYGGHTRGEFEHAEVSVFTGKNPWMSQSFPRARTVLNEIAKDPARSMIVIDPVLTETAKMADFHLRVTPGSDAWCLAALAAVLVQENLCDEAFLTEHVTGADEVRDILREVPIADYAQRCGVDEELLRAAARRIGTAGSVAVFEDLGIQQGPNSTLCSYLNKMLWILTGNFAKRGSQHLHSMFGPLISATSSGVGRTPVTGAPIVAGLVPSNAVPQEILTDHPDRFRAMIVESSNPAHSIADSAACRAAFSALELLVVVDVAMTETARLAHYVLPAASQFEKCEATFFNLEFPHNTFHLRHRLFEPAEGTLPEPEIWSRLVRELGVVSEDDLRPLRDAAKQGRDAYLAAFFAAVGGNPMLNKVLPYVLYETLGPTLPEGLQGAAALWGLAQKAAMTYPDAVRRAGHADGNALFDAILSSTSGMTFTEHEYADDWTLVGHPDRKFVLPIPPLLEDLKALKDSQPGLTTQEFPIVLSAGERRAFTANDILRNPEWRTRDTEGALRVSVEDAATLGLTDGGRARVTTATGSAEAVVEVSETMLAGHASLPNGYGVDFIDEQGARKVPGVAPNELTSSQWRDAYAGTPSHKHVPARIEALASLSIEAWNPRWGEDVVAGEYGGHPGLVFERRPRTFADFLHGVERWSERTFLVQGERRVTAGEFFAAIGTAREMLAPFDIRPGDRVMLLGYNSTEWVLALWTIWSLEAVPVLGNRWWSHPETAHSLALTTPRVVICDVTDLVPDGTPVIEMSGLTVCFTEAAVEIPAIPGPDSEEDPAFILFTSGSTGMPKAVELPFRALVANQQNVLARARQLPHFLTADAPQPVSLLSTPIFHIGAFATLITQTLIGGLVIFNEGRFDPAQVLALIEKEKVQRWGAVPTMAARLLEHPGFDAYDISTLRAFPLGGAPVPPALLERLARRIPQLQGRGLANTWGMSEGAGFFTLATGPELERFPKTVGKPFPTVELMIADPDEEGHGEILVRSPTLMLGYVGMQDGTITAEGWLHTGDIGHLNDEGYLFIDGRSKDMVIRGGENIACPHVEAALMRHPDVVDAAALGLPHPDLGEELAAVVVHRAGRSPTEEELTAHMSDEVAYFAVPTRWIIREQPLPTVGTEKVDKRRLATEFG